MSETTRATRADVGRRVQSSVKIDYLADPRLAKLTFISIKKHVEMTCASRGLPSVELKKKLLGCATKFAIVAVADEYNVELGTLLDEVGPIKPFTPGFKNVDRKLHEAMGVDERRKISESVARPAAKTARLAREKVEEEAVMLRLVDQAAADIAKFKQEREVNLSGEYEKYKQQRAAEMKAGRERLERERFAKVVAPIDAPNAANAAEAPTDAPGVLADSLLEAIAAARVPKGRLDLPVRSHADRLPSGRRGMSRAMLRAIRGFYGPRGALGKLMGDLIIEEGFEASVCALTRSTGLSLIESLALMAEKRGEDASALIGLATTFFSYSWTGTPLGDMLDAVERKLDELEATDGVTRFVWIDIFAASQTLLAGEFGAERFVWGSEDYKERKEDTDHVFADAMAAISEILLYCSPLTAEWLAPNQPYFLPERGEPPIGWMRRGPGAMTRAWCLFELVKALAKGATLHVVLAPADVDGFEALLTTRFDEIESIVAGIDAADAQISKIEDRDYILAEVAKLEGGIGAVTKAVCAKMREWLAAEGHAALMRMPGEKRATSKLQDALARLLQVQGKLIESEPLLREALEARRAAFGDRHPDTLESINHLGSLLFDQGKGKLDEAETLLREALETSRATLGDRHRTTLDSINHLGRLLHVRGKLVDTAPLYWEALEVSRATLGDRHPDTLTSINNLGRLFKDQGKLDEAAPLFREAFEASRATLGDRHAPTLLSINNLGLLLKDQGKLDKAAPLLKEAVEARRATLGDQHPQTLFSINNLGLLLQAQGKLDEAAPLLQEALEARRATLPYQHAQTLFSISNMGRLLQDQGKLDEAAPLCREALEARRATLGSRHPDTLTSISNMGLLLYEQGKLDEAEVLLSEALDGCVATFAEGHRTRLRSQAWLADVRRAQGRIESAHVLIDASVIGMARKVLGPTVDTTLMLEAVHARLQCAEGGGLEPLKSALERMSVVLGREHPETRRCRSALALEEKAAAAAHDLGDQA